MKTVTQLRAEIAQMEQQLKNAELERKTQQMELERLTELSRKKLETIKLNDGKY